MFVLKIEFISDSDGRFYRATSEDFDAAMKKWGYQSSIPFVWYTRNKHTIVPGAIVTMFRILSSRMSQLGSHWAEQAPSELGELFTVEWSKDAKAAPDDLVRST